MPSRHSALSYEHAGKIEQQLKAEVSRPDGAGGSRGSGDVADGMSIPDELARREERLAKLAEGPRQRLKARAKERFEREGGRASRQAGGAGGEDPRPRARSRGGKPPEPRSKVRSQTIRST